jgi:hypothetical protein
LDPYALLALAYAHAAAGYPTGQFVIYVDGATAVEDMSLGLAALNSAMGRESYSALSGTVSPTGAIFAPGDVLKKAEWLNDNGVGLITPYDPDADSELITAFEKAGKMQLISMPTENQYADFTPFGYWPSVILAANVTVVAIAAQFSRYYTVKSGNAQILGQEAPILSTDTVNSFYFDDNGVMKEKDPYIAPTKRLANEPSTKVGKDLFSNVELKELEKWAKDNADIVTLFWRLGEAYAGSKFNAESVPDAIRVGNPTAAQGTKTLKNNVYNWSKKTDSITNALGKTIDHDKAVAILRNADQDQIIKALNITGIGGRDFKDMDEYVKARVEAKIIQHAAAGLAETVSQVKAGRFKYATGYTSQANRKFGGRKYVAQPNQPRREPTQAAQIEEVEEEGYVSPPEEYEQDDIVVVNNEDLLKGLDELEVPEELPPSKPPKKEKKKVWKEKQAPKEKEVAPPAGDQNSQILNLLQGLVGRMDKQEADLKKMRVGGVGARSRPNQ